MSSDHSWLKDVFNEVEMNYSILDVIEIILAPSLLLWEFKKIREILLW